MPTLFRTCSRLTGMAIAARDRVQLAITAYETGLIRPWGGLTPGHGQAKLLLGGVGAVEYCDDSAFEHDSNAVSEP